MIFYRIIITPLHVCATQATLNRLKQPKNFVQCKHSDHFCILSRDRSCLWSTVAIPRIGRGYLLPNHSPEANCSLCFVLWREGFQSTLWPHLIGIFNVKVTLNSSLILSILTYQDQDSKWTRRGYIEKYCRPFWEMAAAEVKGQICDGPIAKNFL